MNLTSLKKTPGKLQIYEQSRLVKRLLQEGYSPKEIVDLSEIEGVDLDKETAKEILSYVDVEDKAILKTSNNVFNFGRGILETLLITPTGLRKLFSEKENVSNYYKVGSGIIAYTSVLGIPFIALHLLLSGGNAKNLIYTIPAHLSTILTSGIYEIYRNEKKKAIEKNISKLEQIASGETLE